MSFLVVLPLLIPLGVAAASLIAWGRHRFQVGVAVAGSAVQLVAAVALFLAVEAEGPLVVQVGDWPAPFGITLVADLLSAIMVVLAAIVGMVVVLSSVTSIPRRLEVLGYYPISQILILGVTGAFLTGDLFNLYVWFEVMLIASFVLLALGGRRPQVEGGLKYVALNLVASMLFLSGAGITYGVAGSLNMADLSVRLDTVASPAVVTSVSMLFLVAFGIKAAVFPLFFWLPASYHTAPIPVAALFAGLLTKVGVYALFRTFTLLFDQETGYTHAIILAIAAFTMIAGVLGAVAERDVRRILSFHIVSQIGYMLIGLGLFTTYALAASIFYVVHHIIVKTALFLVAGVMGRLGGSYELDDLGGLAARSSVLAALFAIPALSLAGLPPFSGFFAKLGLVQAGIADGQYLIVAVALVVSLLTLVSMAKIWTDGFWGAPGKLQTSRERTPAGTIRLLPPIMGLAVLSLAIGFGAEVAFGIAERAAAGLLDPTAYIEAVLGPGSADALHPPSPMAIEAVEAPSP
jgi:multicomponent Na+:H+ antiporter subunit D